MADHAATNSTEVKTMRNQIWKHLFVLLAQIFKLHVT